MAELERLTQVYTEAVRRVGMLYETYRRQWMYENKLHGFDIQVVRLGSLLQRLRHCRLRIEEYLRGLENKEDGHISYTYWHKIVSANVV